MKALENYIVEISGSTKSGSAAMVEITTAKKLAVKIVPTTKLTIKSSNELSSTQSKIVKANKSKIRSAANKINKYQKYNKYHKKK